jgi:lipopolysaccharide transport system ATP-binding protein
MSAGGRLHPSDLKVIFDADNAAAETLADNSATDTFSPIDNVLAIRMPRDAAIEVVNATLQYPVGPYTRGSVKANLFQLFGHKEAGPKITFVEAIRNLDLTIEHGERIGIIGGNGSGKSTLLRALAGIYPLKSGSMKVVGSIGALLDTTLGFETESTGRENIYYRGVAMGYSPKMLRSVEKEIIEFAALGDFIDLPMRTYSAGMYVRLGFAISTQFSPDVLLVDEVFGAGDASFAARAVDRMMRMVRRAGIVMLATHDTALVSRICTRVLWMNNGVLVRDGSPQVVVPQFEQFCAGKLILD